MNMAVENGNYLKDSLIIGVSTDGNFNLNTGEITITFKKGSPSTQLQASFVENKEPHRKTIKEDYQRVDVTLHGIHELQSFILGIKQVTDFLEANRNQLTN